MDSGRDRSGLEGLPAGLERDLRAMYRAPVPVEPRVDEAVLSVARERAALGRRRGVLRLVPWGVAAAAGLAMAVVLGPRLMRPPAGPTGQAVQVAKAEDVNGDGVVDILDALVVKQGVERGISAGAWDFTGDGIVDGRDVDRVAMAAVSLGKGG